MMLGKKSIHIFENEGYVTDTINVSKITKKFIYGEARDVSGLKVRYKLPISSIKWVQIYMKKKSLKPYQTKK